jgi:hypothetical protein
MFNVRTIDPATEPVSVDTQKVFMRNEVVDAAQDTLIGTIISAAREYVELQTRLALITQTWKLTMDRFPTVAADDDWWDGVREIAISELQQTVPWIELPTGPLISVTSFNTFNQADAATLFTNYYTDTSRRPGRVSLRSGAVWPTPTRGVNGIEIIYVAGFGPAAANVPADIRIAISQIASHWFENRELMTFEVSARDVPVSAQRVIDQRRVIRI